MSVEKQSVTHSRGGERESLLAGLLRASLSGIIAINCSSWLPSPTHTAHEPPSGIIIIIKLW